MVAGVRTSDPVVVVVCSNEAENWASVSGGDKNIWSDLHRNSLTEWICVEYSSHLTSDLHTLQHNIQGATFYVRKCGEGGFRMREIVRNISNENAMDGGTNLHCTLSVLYLNCAWPGKDSDE